MKKINSKGIKTNRWFVGLIGTGDTSHESVKAALQKLKKYPSNGLTEILFHPGGVSNKVSIDWTKKPLFKKYYSSNKREKEANILKSSRFKEMIKNFK